MKLVNNNNSGFQVIYFSYFLLLFYPAPAIPTFILKNPTIFILQLQQIVQGSHHRNSELSVVGSLYLAPP